MDFLESLFKGIKDRMQEEMEKRNPRVQIPDKIKEAIVKAVFASTRLDDAIGLMKIVQEENPELAPEYAKFLHGAVTARECGCDTCKRMLLHLQEIMVGDSN